MLLTKGLGCELVVCRIVFLAEGFLYRVEHKTPTSFTTFSTSFFKSMLNAVLHNRENTTTLLGNYELFIFLSRFIIKSLRFFTAAVGHLAPPGGYTLAVLDNISYLHFVTFTCFFCLFILLQ